MTRLSGSRRPNNPESVGVDPPRVTWHFLTTEMDGRVDRERAMVDIMNEEGLAPGAVPGSQGDANPYVPTRDSTVGVLDPRPMDGGL